MPLEETNCSSRSAVRLILDFEALIRVEPRVVGLVFSLANDRAPPRVHRASPGHPAAAAPRTRPHVTKHRSRGTRFRAPSTQTKHSWRSSKRSAHRKHTQPGALRSSSRSPRLQRLDNRGTAPTSPPTPTCSSFSSLSVRPQTRPYTIARTRVTRQHSHS